MRHRREVCFILFLAQYTLLSLGMAFAGYWAYQAFDRPPIKLGDGPALPRYMTQPSQYRLGVIVFVGTCLLVYSLIAYFNKQLLPIVGAINPELQNTIEKSMKDGSLPYPLVVIFSAAIFVSLLKIEKDWNPIFLLRRVVHGWVSIPQIANALMVMMRDQLLVPEDVRAGVAHDPDTPYVTVGDFDKDRLSLDRCWAELCYIRLWLERHRTQGSHFTFFNEPSFAWERLQANFDDARDRIAPLKRGDVTHTNAARIFADVAAEVDSLRRQYCRLAACFLVFKNETQKDALRDAKQFGVTITPDAPRANPLRYTVIFFGAIIIAIYLGVSLSAMAWNLVHHNPSDPEDATIATKWMFYALANYGMPIMAVLLLRYLGWRSDRTQPNSYLISYATVFLVGLCVAVTCNSVAQMVVAQIIPGQGATGGFGQTFYNNIKWGFSPAIVSIYVIYHVDQQIDPLLPDMGPFEHWRLPQRLMSCVFFGFLVTGFSVLPTLSISVSRSSWPVGKLHLVIIGTIFIVGLTMALVGEFLIIKPTPASDRLEGIDTLSPAKVVISKQQQWKSWALAGPLAAVLMVGLAIWAYNRIPASVVPQWTFDSKPVYLGGERIPLTWTYKPPVPSASVYFEIESRAASTFSLEACTDAEHYYVDRANGTREWIVRAVADCGTKKPVSDWSRAIKVTQYDSIYQRIKSKGQVDIFVSSSQDQDLFKWRDQGFDIDLAGLIVRDLSARIGHELKVAWRPVPWENLLPAVEDGSADLAISSITKTSARERKYSIQFTDGYYCTTYALIYQTGTQEGRIRDMVKGKTVGVQRETTSSELAAKLAADGLFRIMEFDNTEGLRNALVGSRVDLGITDTSFARSAQLDMRLSNGVDRLKFKEFGQDDLPLMQDERTQEYAVAVRKGEIELLGAINETLTRAKQAGELASLFKTSAEKYEAFKYFLPGSRSLGQRPWECVSPTIGSSRVTQPSLPAQPPGRRARLRLSASLGQRLGAR
jgi:ABC-type amino acid transport substrate-binding protein